MRVPNLPAGAAANEAPQLRIGALPSPRRLLLEGAERSEVALGVENAFDGGGAKCTDQLVLQVYDTDVETQPLHVEARELGAEAGPLETVPEQTLLARVTETGQSHVRPLGAESSQEAPQRLRTADWHDRDALPVEVPTTTRSEGFERDLIADSFDQNYRTCDRADSFDQNYRTCVAGPRECQ